MAKKHENGNYQQEIYENLPCQAMYNDSVRKLQANDLLLLNNSNLNSLDKPNLTKEMLYATPLKKQDRPKVKGDSNNLSDLSCNERTASAKITKIKLSKEIENHTDAYSDEKADESKQLDEHRILNFLKDSSQLQKKMEMHRKFQNSDISYFAKEENFANMVQQNVKNELYEDGIDVNYLNTETNETDEKPLDPTDGSSETQSKQSAPSTAEQTMNGTSSVYDMNINREWILKKIVICLEQRLSRKPQVQVNEKLPIGNDPTSSKKQQSQSSSMHLGCLLIGSNGSGKTTVCESILNGNVGTKGILNRKLIGSYFINSQNPDCHNLSIFIRSLVLQILSYSTYCEKFMQNEEPKTNEVDIVGICEALEQTVLSSSTILDTKAEEERLISELKKEDENESIEADRVVGITRQKSHPEHTLQGIDENSSPFNTHPPRGINGNKNKTEVNVKQQSNKSTPRKTSKIPVKIGSKIQSSTEASENTDESEQKNSGEQEKVDGNSMDDKKEDQKEETSKIESQTIDEKAIGNEEMKAKEDLSINAANSMTDSTPAPLPKTKNCRSQVADAYYELLISNAEIFESLMIDNIEKNPDECFKKAFLFPLLELTPPKTALLLLIDSIDENYINEGTLITTLKGRSSNKSRNIAELLSNHIHLFPKWLLLVSTARKQSKHITKMFSGFKKINLDDLKKTHVVKDVQEYIINRLNSDFKGSVNLTKDVIESLNQLYLKSNGCILYLEKVLNGIKENFFSFREIKLIPCTLNGLYLYICQKSFNKKQYTRIRPILNILLASNGFVDRLFILNCLKTHIYTIELDDFEKRLECMKNILVMKNDRIKLFHNSFSDWLVDVKFATKKFLCDVNEGHIMISMYYTLVSDTLCPNEVRKYSYHLVKSAEHLCTKGINLDLTLILLESKANLNDSFYTNCLNCCSKCENDFKCDRNNTVKVNQMIDKFLNSELSEEFCSLLYDLFKPNLPTDTKIFKLLIDTGVNNAESYMSCESSLTSPLLSERSQNIDSELADLLVVSEKACKNDVIRSKSPLDAEIVEAELSAVSESNLNLMKQISECHGIEMHKGKALIHILANDGNSVLLDRALKACKNQIDLEIEDINGQSALNIAARNGHLEVVKILLDFKQVSEDDGTMIMVDINHTDHDGWTPLRSASWGGHTEVVKLLLSHKDCAIDLADKEGRTAIRAAAWSGHEDILKLLIEAGADVNSIDKQGRTSLIAASYMGHYEIVEILLDNGADVNHLDLDGRSALCVAALCGSSGYGKVISCLLDHGANTDQLDNDGMSPLLVSSFEGNSEICELLLENGADPDLSDFIGRTPLWAACTAGHSQVAKLLLFWGCGIDCMDAEGRTVLSIAAAQGNTETVRQLLDRGLDETHRDNAGWTPLHYAAFEGYPDVCVQLLESGAKIDESDNEGKTPLHLAAQEGREDVIDALLQVHNACIDQKAHDGKTAFCLACIEGHFGCVAKLLKYGCDVNAKDADSRTTLYILALENKVKMVKFLLEHSSIDVNIPDSEGRTALHVAAWQGHAEMVKYLISKGNADVNAMDLECRTPLHSCAWQGNHEVMEILLFCGAIADHSCKQGATALGISAQEGHDKCVSILLHYNANPFKTDHCGRTPIKLATKSNRTNVLKIFENYSKNEAVNFELKQHMPMQLKSPDQNIIHSAIGSQMVQQGHNFYENTMHSDASLKKRRSAISSHSTVSSNEQAPLSFTQQLMRQNQRHSRNMNQNKSVKVNSSSANVPSDADMFEIGCMSPLYATPPHSPSSDLSSPGHQTGRAIGQSENNGQEFTNNSNQIILPLDHFVRDTHMRIILGNKESNQSSSNNKSKRSGITSNPAVRMIRNRFDSAAQLIRRTNNILNITSSSNNQGSSSIGVKSGTFQWRKE